MTPAATVDVLIAPDGKIRFIWTDAISPLLPPLGTVRIQRASHVEPTLDGQWTADMSPVGGPVLGPFPLRGTALQEEIAWLVGNNVPVPNLKGESQ